MQKKKTKEVHGYDEWLKADKKKLIREWGAMGLSEGQIANNMGISRTTLYTWKNDCKDLAELIQSAKQTADTEVMNALYERAKGYTYVETKSRKNEETGKMEVVEEYERHQPADLSAIQFWLKNRQPAEWKQKPEDEEATENEIHIVFGGGSEEYGQ